MERFKVQGDDLRQHYRNRANTVLGDIFWDIERELKAERRVVCQYVVNGHPIAEKDESRLSILSINEIETLEYTSEKTEVLLNDVIESWLQALPELMRGAEHLAGRLSQEIPRGLVKSLHDLIENCQFLLDSLISVRRLVGEGETEALSDFDVAHAEMARTVRDAIGHLERKDFVHLSQTIEYDLNHGLEQFRQVLLRFQSVLAKNGQGLTVESDGNAKDPRAVGRRDGDN